MNEDELKAFEKELADLRPRGPSPRLRAQLDAMVDAKAGDRPRERATEVVSRQLLWRRLAPWTAVAAGLLFAAIVLWWKPFSRSLPGHEIVAEDSREVASAALPGERAADDSPASDFRPVKARNSLRNRIDEGLVTLEGGLSARQYRFQFVDTVVWENARDGSQFEVSTPREEIVLVPVHTF